MTKSLKVMLGAGALVLGGCEVSGADGAGVQLDQAELQGTLNAAGVAETLHTSGTIDRTNGFFQTIGTNARTCETCHAAAGGWTLSAQSAAFQFLTSQGQAPLFMLQDAGSRPDADISTLAARRTTFDTTTHKGLIRFTRNLTTIPATAEYTVVSVVDPSGFSDLTKVLSFRRPTPTANESKASSTGWTGGPLDVATAVLNTTGGAARLHEQRVDVLPPEQAAPIRDFQLGVIVAQKTDFQAGRLDADGAHGGAAALMAQPFHLGINDIQGLDPAGAPYNAKIFDLYDAWARYDRRGHEGDAGPLAARAAIYRGQQIFNTRTFTITGTHGVNDLLGQASVQGTCGTCHNTPNVGGHSVFRMFDIGSADAPRCDPAFPLVTIQNKTTGATRTVCDLARGTNGVWADVGSFRAPPLRGLAARAPYFHDGQAESIEDVVKYHNDHFSIGLSGRERKDLEAFLSAL
jgi:cytochrome c peroxidase